MGARKGRATQVIVDIELEGDDSNGCNNLYHNTITGTTLIKNKCGYNNK